jgi:GntR family transcriptional regulator
MLNKAIGMPLHAQLTAVLREQINTGKLSIHTKLPSERELCAEYGISRITVRKALAKLIHEGLVYSSVGKGIYIAEPKLEKELQPLISITEDARRRGVSVSSQVLEAAIIYADNSLAIRLQVSQGVEVVKLHRLRLMGNIPAAIQCAYLPHHLCPNLLRYDFSSRSLLDVLRTEYKLKLTRAKSDIEAALAQDEEASLLELPTPAAVLVAEQTTYLENEAVIEFVRSAFPGGGRYRFTATVCVSDRYAKSPSVGRRDRPAERGKGTEGGDREK